MNTRKRCTNALALAFVAALSLMPATRPAAAAAPDAAPPQDVSGEWRGFFADVEHPDFRAPVRLSVTAQLVRRFEGALEVLGCDGSVRVQGTVAASDNVSFLTGGGETCAVVGKSRLHDFGGGGAVLNGRMTLRSADGTKREGTLVLLRNFTTPPDPAVPGLSGDWRGSYTSEVTGATAEMTARFAQSHRDPAVNSFIAEVTIIPCIFPEALATVSSDGRVIVIAQGEGEHAILQGTLRQHQNDGLIIPCIRGTYQMEHDDGLQDFGSFHIDKTT